MRNINQQNSINKKAEFTGVYLLSFSSVHANTLAEVVI